jgi:hypothetical protein
LSLAIAANNGSTTAPGRLAKFQTGGSLIDYMLQSVTLLVISGIGRAKHPLTTVLSQLRHTKSLLTQIK